MSDIYTFSQDAPVDEAPERVVSLVPSVTEAMFDLALGDKLVGRTDYCILPADKVSHIPSVGGTKNPDIEHIIALAPGLVIANYEENRRQDVEALESAGVPVWVTFPQTIQDVFNLLWNIMYLFDTTEMVARIRLIEQIYDRYRTLAETAEAEETMPRVFVPIWYEPLMTANAETYLHDVLYTCGGMNIFANRERRFPLAADLGEAESQPAEGRDTRYPRVSRQEVEALQPDIILLPSEPFQFTEEHMAIFQTWDVPAAHQNRIFLVDGTLLTWHGTRIAHALDTLPDLLRINS